MFALNEGKKVREREKRKGEKDYDNICCKPTSNEQRNGVGGVLPMLALRARAPDREKRGGETRNTPRWSTGPRAGGDGAMRPSASCTHEYDL